MVRVCVHRGDLQVYTYIYTVVYGCQSGTRRRWVCHVRCMHVRAHIHVYIQSVVGDGVVALLTHARVHAHIHVCIQSVVADGAVALLTHARAPAHTHVHTDMYTHLCLQVLATLTHGTKDDAMEVCVCMYIHTYTYTCPLAYGTKDVRTCLCPVRSLPSSTHAQRRWCGAQCSRPTLTPTPTQMESVWRPMRRRAAIFQYRFPAFSTGPHIYMYIFVCVCIRYT